MIFLGHHNPHRRRRQRGKKRFAYKAIFHRSVLALPVSTWDKFGESAVLRDCSQTIFVPQNRLHAEEEADKFVRVMSRASLRNKSENIPANLDKHTSGTAQSNS